MHSKRKFVCGILFTIGAATGPFINAGVAVAVPVVAPGNADPCSNRGNHHAVEADAIHDTVMPGLHLGQRCGADVVVDAEPVIVVEVDPVIVEEVETVIVEEVETVIVVEVDPVIVEEIEPVIVVEADPMIVEEIEPVIVVEADPVIVEEIEPVIVVEADPVISEVVEPVVVVEADPVIVEEIEPVVGEVEGSVDIGDAFTVVREQPVTPVVVRIPEAVAPMAMIPEAPTAAPVAAAPAAVVRQPAPKATTPVVAPAARSTRSTASVTTPSKSEVLGVQYSRLATTGSDPLPLAVLALGLLLLGGVMVSTSRQHR